MIEFHDHPGDEHEHVPEPDIDLTDDRSADAFAEHQPAPLGDLPADADTAPELHFPGDEPVAQDSPADLDPKAPWPDDGAFTQWLAGHDDTAAEGDPAPAADELASAPEDSEALPSTSELVDWTLRRLGD